MKWSYLALVLGASFLFLAGVAVGRVTVTSQLVEQAQASDTPVMTTASAAGMPETDIPGADVAGLPRYPGATRVEYRQTSQDGFLLTEVEYVVAAELDEVHTYYRRIFPEEWSVADLGFYQGEWTFFVVSGNREALVEIEARGPLIEIEIELSEPQLNDGSTTVAPEAGKERNARAVSSGG